MAKFLNISQMLDAALDSNMPGMAQFVEQAESLATNLGRNLAQHLQVDVTDAVWEGEEFGGLCAKFGPLVDGAACPIAIDQRDFEGDWSEFEPPRLTKAERRPGKLALPSDRD